nr:hypothetical protein [Neobacillus sp. Marseille-Q6967]
MIKKLALLGISIFLLLPLAVSAETGEICKVSSLVGDKDYFGGNCWDVQHEPEDGVFDTWDSSDKSWTHSYTPISSGSIISASLTVEMVMYSQDAFEPDIDLALYIDGQEIPNAFNVSPSTYPVNIFEFHLEPSIFNKLEDGSALVEIKHKGHRIDYFALDYATLDVTYKCNTQVIIDIKPGSDPSSFGVNSNGKIPVALFGSETFDVTQVADSTVRFGDSENSGALSTKAGLEDINGDGFIDKVYHFYFPETNLDESDTLGYLTGKLLNGTRFIGSSDLNIVGTNEALDISPDEEVTEVEDNGRKMMLKTKK